MAGCACAPAQVRKGERGESRTGAESEHVTYLRHYLSLLLNLSVLSLFNARRNRAYLAQFTRVERDSALHCQRTQAMFVLARLPCMRPRCSLMLESAFAGPSGESGAPLLNIQLVCRTQRFHISYLTNILI